MASEALYSVGNAREVFADTSYFYALLNARDHYHPRAVEISKQVGALGAEVCTTWDVVVETVTVLRYRAGFDLAKLFITKAPVDLTILHPLEAERELAIKVFLQRSRERELSLCDALSYAIVSTRLDWAPCLSFDADFAALGLTVFA
jgi:predicted nucleic acid-binding protein